MNNEAIIQHFYTSFAKGDVEAMIQCYAPNVVFSDPAFGTLQGSDAGDMWRMLIGRAKGNIQIEFDKVQADGQSGSANWVATYPFSQTGRTVVNKISARFEFKDGKITRHTDHFDLWKWSAMALGWKGTILGWTPFMQNKIRGQALASLRKYTGA